MIASPVVFLPGGEMVRLGAAIARLAATLGVGAAIGYMTAKAWVEGLGATRGRSAFPEK